MRTSCIFTEVRIEILKFVFTQFQFKIVDGVLPNFNKASIDLRFRKKWANLANVLTVD